MDKLIACVNRKEWWHVPPQDPTAYRRRGKFLASSFREAEFWGRSLDEPQRVAVSEPMVGDETTKERLLFGRPVSRGDTSIEQRWALDARVKRTALAKGDDSIVFLTAKAFAALKAEGKLPRSIELIVLGP